MPLPWIFPVKRIGARPGVPGVGTDPFMPPVALTITGVTRDSTGAPLGGCAVKLFRSSDNLLMDWTTSDGSGNFTFTNVGMGESYYAVAYLAGSPDVAGTTVNTLTGV